MTSTPIRVFVVDDHAIVREGVGRVLERDPRIRVIGGAGSRVEALRFLDENEPDVVLLDITLPDASGLDVVSEMTRSKRACPVLIFSIHDQAAYMLEAVRAGAAGYVVKDTDPEELRRAVITVAEGGRHFSERIRAGIDAALLEERGSERERALLDRLTAREQEVLLKVAEGLTNKAIAAELDISRRTVETHRESLMRKTDIHTVAGLTRFAIRTGLLPDAKPSP